MKASNELFNLVKSLSKSEKRFFKLSSSLQAGEKNYLKIFDAIDKQKEYDEEAIKHQFRKEVFVQHFPSEKNHLYKLVLKSLRSYHSDNSISSVLKEEMKNIEILYKKALFKECNKFLIRAKKMAIEHEKFYFWFELLRWEKLLMEEAFEAGKFDSDLDKLIIEEQEVIDKLRNLAEYEILYSKINYVFRRGGYVRTPDENAMVDEISDHPLIKGKNTARSYRAATICYYVKGLCYTTKRKYTAAAVSFGRAREIMDQNPLIRKDLPERYVRTLNKLLFFQIENHDYEATEKLLQEMKSLPEQAGFEGVDIKVKIFTSSSLSRLLIFERQGEFLKAVEIIDEIQAQMEVHREKLNKEQELLFYYTFSYIFFGAGMFNKSLQWLNKVLNDNESKLRQDIYSFSRLFNLVIHYELGNYDHLEYIIKSTFRYLHKRQRAYQVETTIIKYLRKIAKVTDEDKITAQFKDLLQEVKNIFKQDASEKVILEYFDCIAWIESKINGLSYAEAIIKSRQGGIKAGV